jgi:sulfur relay protein TusB/DsrH
MTLHIVSQSPFHNCALDSCLAVAAPADVILLINDGVYALQKPTNCLNERIEKNLIFALADDLLARGISRPELAIDYNTFVALSCKHNPIHSWY